MPIFCRGKLSDDDSCIWGIDRPTLIETIDPESTNFKILFWTLFIVCWCSIYLGLYAARTVFLLALIEDEAIPGKSDPRMVDVALMDEIVDDDEDRSTSKQPQTQSETEATDDDDDDDDDDGRNDTGDGGLQQCLLFEQQRRHTLGDETTRIQRTFSALRELSTQIYNAMLSTGRELFLYPVSQDNLVTRNVPTAIRQLRYCSTSSTFLFRALPYYVVVWMMIPRTFAVAGSLMWMTVEILARMAYYLVRMRRLVLPSGHSWPMMAICRAVAPAVFQRLFTFHTLRILSASTGFSTNFVSEHIRDRSLFRYNDYYHTRFRWIPSMNSGATMMHIEYGVLETIPGIVYYFLTRSLNISKTYYDLDNPHSSPPDKSHSSTSNNFMLSNPERRNYLFKSLTAWLVLSLLSIISLGTLLRIHARSISPTEPTIVDFSTDNFPSDEILSSSSEDGDDDDDSNTETNSHPTPNRLTHLLSYIKSTPTTILTHLTTSISHELTYIQFPPPHKLLRVTRITIQLILFLLSILTFISLTTWIMIHKLQNGDLFADWLSRCLLEPDSGITFTGVVWNAVFWYDQVWWAFNPVWPVERGRFGFSGGGDGVGGWERPKVW